MKPGDTTPEERAARAAQLTGNENAEILAGNDVQAFYRTTTFLDRVKELEAYYCTKQLAAQHDAEEVMKWQMHRVVLTDLVNTFNATHERGEQAKQRLGWFRRQLARLDREPHRLDRFRAGAR